MHAHACRNGQQQLRVHNLHNDCASPALTEFYCPAAYPLNSTAAATLQQSAAALQALRLAQQPSADCCQRTSALAANGCPCDPLLGEILRALDIQPVALNAAVGMLGEACGTFAAPAC